MDFKEEDRLIVGFENRADAKAHKAVYAHGSFFLGTPNGFYVPTAEITNDEDGQISSTDREYLLMEYGSKEVAEEKKRAAKWNEALATKDTLTVATALRDLGMPKQEIQRVEMLNIFRNPGRGLRIGYDALLKFSEGFYELYNEEQVKKIVVKYLQGGSDYLLTLENSSATREEKELLLFVFPDM